MQVSVRFDFSDYDREALSHRYGKNGKATRTTIEEWMIGLIYAAIEDVRADYHAQEEE